MFKAKIFLQGLTVCGLLSTVLLSGCVVRTYTLTRDRVDQDLAGNRGYLQGQPPAGQDVSRKSTRDTHVMEIELRSPIRFEKGVAPAKTEIGSSNISDSDIYGNRGYTTESVTPEVVEIPGSFERYTVQKGDTLQKISQKQFGTTKKWYKIYEANKDTMKGPNKVYPGQTIKIPMDGKSEKLIEPKENLK
ncbi:MAG: LysM peptidoglycan-binding domain-containing protein [Candidatus Omnitrophota bacterium]